MNALLARLKEHTWDCHKRLERRLPFFDAEFSRSDYLRLLQCFLGYHRPLEFNLAGQAKLSKCLPDFAQRLKTPLLETDIETLGMARQDIAVLPSCPEQPPVTDLPAAFGCLYVVEGATLGGQVISRHLQAKWNMDAARGAQFFTAYGAETPERWRVFGECLAAAVQGESEQAQALQAARATFIRLESWMEQCGLLKPAAP